MRETSFMDLPTSCPALLLNEKTFLCGIDEAGRGPLAGPVSAAAVILKDDFPIGILDDSKKIKVKEREEIKNIIISESLYWGIGWASPAEIDEINILQASLLAMKRAFDSLNLSSNLSSPFSLKENVNAIIDGLYVPQIPVPCTALVKADSKIPEVMAASILAKCARDRLMEYYAIFFPQYGYEKHKGYPTKAHREAILKYGPSPIQRRSFSYRTGSATSS